MTVKGSRETERKVRKLPVEIYRCLGIILLVLGRAKENLSVSAWSLGVDSKSLRIENREY